ncbi:MAG TPA: ribulose-phosphate 3-epimerase, partial [Acidimicrobiales bacterium]|nr:ribulose-phosphate 3-epimerase [Acidimicrobiales bacterium]
MRTSVGELVRDVPEVSVGLHAADVLRLGEELDALGRAGVRVIHLDVMDGIFCPQMTFGPLVVQAVGEEFVKDVHLMVHEPLTKLESYVAAGASIITFHLESTEHPHRALASLATSGVLRGIALNPGTPVEWVEPLLDELDLVLLLAIDPGWAGQPFTPATGRRLEAVRRLAGDRPILVGIDGAVTRENIARVAALGSDLIVSGSAVFTGDTEAGA